MNTNQTFAAEGQAGFVSGTGFKKQGQEITFSLYFLSCYPGKPSPTRVDGCQLMTVVFPKVKPHLWRGVSDAIPGFGALQSLE